jgi:hypothetical protein
MLFVIWLFGYGRQWNRRQQKNTSQMREILITMWMQWCDVGRITRWSTSRAPPSGKRLRHIAPAAAMVDDFSCKHKNTSKTQFLASNYGKNQPQFHTPKWTIYSVH